MCRLCSLFAANCGADRDWAGQGVLYAQTCIASHLLCPLFYVDHCVSVFLCRPCLVFQPLCVIYVRTRNSQVKQHMAFHTFPGPAFSSPAFSASPFVVLIFVEPSLSPVRRRKNNCQNICVTLPTPKPFFKRFLDIFISTVLIYSALGGFRQWCTV